jgi:hypothetical protein
MGLKRPGATLAAIVAVISFAGCTSSSTRATGQVDSASFGRICFTPENSDRTDLTGCWPINASDAAGLEQGDCISALIPHDATDRVTGVRELDRVCHVGVEPTVSSDVALENALWIAAMATAIVTFAVILPRLRRRRAARRKAGTRSIPANAPLIVDSEPTEVEVVDLTQTDRTRERLN